MKTDVITVSSRGNRIGTALEQADKAAAYQGLTGKDALHLRLLTEEMMGMMRSITGETEGRFWIEDQDDEYRLHLQVAVRLSSEKREKLLSASSSGRNESAKGLMGRLRDFFDWGSDEEMAEFSSPLFSPELFEHSSSPTLDWEWSMRRYESALETRVGRNESGAEEAWDELEKSVVANIADEIQVSIVGCDVEITVFKSF